MAATVTLSTTRFTSTVESGDSKVILASTAGITAAVSAPTGTFLYVDRELMAVERFTGIGNEAVVRRGMDGTTATRHANNAVVTIGRADQFYDTDPKGLPSSTVLVSPFINIRTGVQWVAVGDDVGPGNAGRVWSAITVASAPGALGVRVTTTTTPS